MKPQFSIFSLLVLTTVVAIGCAINALPNPPNAKMCPVFSVAICYYGWVVRNRKYPDPRQPTNPTTRFWAFALSAGIDTPIILYLLFARPWTPQFTWLWYLLASSIAAVTAVRLWLAIKPEPKPQPSPFPCPPSRGF
jgi:hypothetical protein